jgi:oligopeptide/dipeptide ABC transporter ATP-binding protein
MTSAIPDQLIRQPQPEPGSDPLLSVTDLTTTFATPAGAVHAVRGVSFAIGAGEVVGLVGESGSGKTVTALSLLRLLPSSARTTGSIRYRGRDIIRMGNRELRGIRGADISMIFQDPMTSLDPLFTIESQVVGVIRAHQKVSRSDASSIAAKLLRDVGIADVATRLHQYPHQLSGGMRQRVLIAMALANEPGLLIADEPTTALDVTIQAQIIRVLKDACARTGMSVLLVTHDLGVVAGICDRLFVMYGGRLVETGPASVVYPKPEHPYTAGLLGSVIRPDRDRSTRLHAIEGQPPIMLNPPPACPFAPRCEAAVDKCKEEMPELTTRGSDHQAACFVTEDRHAAAV